MPSKKEWKAEAEYWRTAHSDLTKQVDRLSWTVNYPDHPNGIEGGLHALYYANTGAMPPSPLQMRQLRRLLEQRNKQ